MILHFDIESRPDPNFPEDKKPKAPLKGATKAETIAKKEKDWAENPEGLIKKMSCDPRMNMIISIEACGSDGKFLWNSWEMTEKEQLEAFWEAVKRFDSVQGFGIAGYDIPTILQRSIILNVEVTTDFSNSSKYKRFPVYDSQLVLSPNNAPEKDINLDFYCWRYGLPAKTGKGSQVYQMFCEGKIKEISEYCRNDVIAEKALFEKIINYYPVPRNYDREQYQSN